MKLLLENWNKFVINESSLSRLHKHISEHDTAVVTAFRNDPTDANDCSGEASAPSEEQDALKINKERNRELKATLLRKGYGVTRVDGSYIEDFGDVDKQKEVSEESFFVVNLKDAADFREEPTLIFLELTIVGQGLVSKNQLEASLAVKKQSL